MSFISAISNPQRILTENKKILFDIFKKENINLSFQDLKILNESMNVVTSEISALEVGFGYLNNISKRMFKDNSDLVNYYLRYGKNTKEVVNALIKQINKTREGKIAYREEGFFGALEYALMTWKNINQVVSKDLYNLIERVKEDNYISLSDFKLGDLIIINILALNPMVIVLFQNLYCILISALEKTDESEYETFFNVLKDNINSTSFTILFNLCYDLTLYRSLKTSLSNSLNKNGINFNIFSTKYNAFDILSLKDLPVKIINILRFTPASKKIFNGNLIVWYKYQQIEKLQALKYWIEQKIIYLKMKKNEIDKDSEEYERILETIEFYENQLQKINHKLESLYS